MSSEIPRCLDCESAPGPSTEWEWAEVVDLPSINRPGGHLSRSDANRLKSSGLITQTDAGRWRVSPRFWEEVDRLNLDISLVDEGQAGIDEWVETDTQPAGARSLMLEPREKGDETTQQTTLNGDNLDESERMSLEMRSVVVAARERARQDAGDGTTPNRSDRAREDDSQRTLTD